MSAVPPERKKRVRLSPAIRREQILEAALIEFSSHGFDGANVEAIARRVGMSQAGLYAHFKSKDDMLASLLGSTLMPAVDWATWTPATATTAEGFVDALLNSIYGWLAQPRVLAVIRLLIVEGDRIPELMIQWRRRMLADTRSILNRLIAAGVLRDSVLSRDFMLVCSPAMHTVLWRLLIGDGAQMAREIRAMRAAHRALLMAMVVPGDPATPAVALAPGARTRASRKPLVKPARKAAAPGKA